MSGRDGTSRPAKSPPHGGRNDHIFEHEDITDNRQLWEVLEANQDES